MGKYNRFCSFWVSKIMLVKAKIIALSDMILKIFVKPLQLGQGSKKLWRFLKFISLNSG